MSGARPARELVYCHACSNEFTKEGDDLTCPQCRSDFTEVVRSSLHNGVHPHDPARPEMDDLDRRLLYDGFRHLAVMMRPRPDPLEDRHRRITSLRTGSQGRRVRWLGYSLPERTVQCHD